MIKQIETTISLLRQKVNQNLKLINENQSQVREILQEPVSNDRTEHFGKYFNINKHLLQENKEILEVQITLINFLDRYRKLQKENKLPLAGASCQPSFRKTEKPSLKQACEQPKSVELTEKKAIVEDTEDVLFEKTVGGILSWNRFHPMFSNRDFYNRLMEYYIENENYEACEKLTKHKGFKD